MSRVRHTIAHEHTVHTHTKQTTQITVEATTPTTIRTYSCTLLPQESPYLLLEGGAASSKASCNRFLASRPSAAL